MLLPSAFPCNGLQAATSRPTRPQLHTFAAYTPLPKQETTTRDYGLLSSCRALHGVLGNPLRSPRPTTKTTQTKARNSFDAQLRVTKPKIPRAAIPQGANKRGRDSFEADLHNTHYGANSSEQPPDTSVISTPKRRRRIPLDMPLGLCATDFQSLEPAKDHPSHASDSVHEDNEGDLNMPELSHDCLSDAYSDDEVDSGYGASNGPSPTLSAVADPAWTFDDDRILVETVLEKLQLSKRAWNGCARRLGKDKDSIGRRWKLLVDEGEVGLKLRRGGSLRRAAIDVPGW